VIAPEVSRGRLKRLQRQMIVAGERARRDPSPVMQERAAAAAVAYEHAKHAWGL
jgi:hypothetical protein